MDLKDAINYLEIGIRQMPYSHVSFETLEKSIRLIQSKLQFIPSTNTTEDKIKPCSNKDCTKHDSRYKANGNCSIFIRSAIGRCLLYKA